MTAALSLSPPFPRGGTYGATSSTDGQHLEGTEWIFEDLDYSAAGPAKPARTNRKVRVRIVRNSSGIALLPKRLAAFKVTGKYGNQVDGYTTTTAARGYPIDEFLPSTGVANNDLFYIVMEGPAVILTQLSSLGSATIAIGDWVVAITGATSQCTTSGRMALQDLTGATQPLAIQIMHRLGTALSAATTGQTNADIMVDVGQW